MISKEFTLVVKMTVNISLIYVSLLTILNMISLVEMHQWLAIPLDWHPLLIAISIWVLMATFPTNKSSNNTLTDWHVMANNRLQFYFLGTSIISVLHLGVIYAVLF